MELLVDDVAFADVEAEVRSILEAVDRGDHDQKLLEAGIQRDPSVSLAENVTLSEAQPLSPDEWAKIIVDFAPFAATVATSVWNIVVVPLLKRIFRSDQVKSADDKS